MKKSALFATTFVILGIGCGGGDAPPAQGDPPSSPEAGPPPAPPAEADPVARWAARLPDSLRHRSGACPFECCMYGDWTPTGDVPLRPAPSHAEPVGAMIAADQTFDADSGFVRITGVSLVAVTASVAAEEGGGSPLSEGDTLVVLDYVGEGSYNVWDGQRVRQLSGFWGAEIGQPKGMLLGGERYAREWWVHASTRAGEKGWFNADSVARLRGVDACGGPDPI